MNKKKTVVTIKRLPPLLFYRSYDLNKLVKIRQFVI